MRLSASGLAALAREEKKTVKIAVVVKHLLRKFCKGCHSLSVLHFLTRVLSFVIDIIADLSTSITKEGGTV